MARLCQELAISGLILQVAGHFGETLRLLAPDPHGPDGLLVALLRGNLFTRMNHHRPPRRIHGLILYRPYEAYSK